MMHCPNCGQQQTSKDINYCSRCGLPLGLIAEVVSKGGYLPELDKIANEKKPVFSKKNGVIFGLFWFAFFSMFCTSFFAILRAPDQLVGLLAVIGFFIGMMIAIGSLIFLPSSKPKYTSPNLSLPPPVPTPDYLKPSGLANNALPHSQPRPIQEISNAEPLAVPRIGRWIETNDLEPNSVTDNTTRLFDRKDQ